MGFFLLALALVGTAIAVASFSPNLVVANAFMSFVMGINSLFNGFLIPWKQLPKYW